jgi:hypothetical protein
MTQGLRWANCDLKILRARGAKVFLFKDHKDKESLEQLRRLLWQHDAHVILSWLEPSELTAIRPLLNERKNFSLVAVDWWIQPHWFMREADYIIFRMYHGIAVRLGKRPFLTGPPPPLLLNPIPHFSSFKAVGPYYGAATLLRPGVLAISPLMNAWNWWRRRREAIIPEKYLFLPFAINCVVETPLKPEKLQYDFANTAFTSSAWLMRDPQVPFNFTFANLYHDRELLVDTIARFENNPFTFYDCRREKNYFLPYDMYLQKSRQSRYVVATGGLHDVGLPKFLEYAYLGTPMIGRGVPFELPWLENCLFTLDPTHLTPTQVKPLLEEALDRYPTLKANCLNLRDRLLKLYDFNTLLDMLQRQADGEPIPTDYLRFPSTAEAQANTAITAETVPN